MPRPAHHGAGKPEKIAAKNDSMEFVNVLMRKGKFAVQHEFCQDETLRLW